MASSRQAGGTEQGTETADRNRSEDGSQGVRGKEEAVGGNEGTGEVAPISKPTDAAPTTDQTGGRPVTADVAGGMAASESAVDKEVPNDDL